MRLKSLSNKALQEEIVWSKCYAMIRQMEKRYEKQPKDEQYKEYCELHAVYQKYWDEAVRRKLVLPQKLATPKQ
jgi:hypothetical protein